MNGDVDWRHFFQLPIDHVTWFMSIYDAVIFFEVRPFLCYFRSRLLCDFPHRFFVKICQKKEMIKNETICL